MAGADTFETFDRRFNDLIIPTAALEELHAGCRWAEGPVWFADANCLLWSDIPNERILRYAEGGPASGAGHVSIFRARSNYANGNTRDRQGRLITCEHGPRRVPRTEPDGTITVLTERYRGKRLNSPNDVVVKSDGTVWFTDPSYGIASDYEGFRAEPELAENNVFRLDPDLGALEVVAGDFVRPNGLAFSPDERTLYIADSGANAVPGGPHHIRAFDVDEAGTLSRGRIFCEADPGLPDGFRCDEAGNVWTSCADGILVYAPDGTRLGRIRVPQVVSNLTFGGPKRNRLFITATRSLYAIYVAANGAQRP